MKATEQPNFTAAYQLAIANELLRRAGAECPPQRDYFEQLRRAPPTACSFQQLGRAIDCALMAFLVARRVDVDDLLRSGTGHRLNLLLKEAKRRHIGRFCNSITARECSLIEELAEGYDPAGTAGPEKRLSGLPSYPELFRAAQRLVESLRQCV